MPFLLYMSNCRVRGLWTYYSLQNYKLCATHLLLATTRMGGNGKKIKQHQQHQVRTAKSSVVVMKSSSAASGTTASASVLGNGISLPQQKLGGNHPSTSTTTKPSWSSIVSASNQPVLMANLLPGSTAANTAVNSVNISANSNNTKMMMNISQQLGAAGLVGGVHQQSNNPSDVFLENIILLAKNRDYSAAASSSSSGNSHTDSSRGSPLASSSSTSSKVVEDSGDAKDPAAGLSISITSVESGVGSLESSSVLLVATEVDGSKSDHSKHPNMDARVHQDEDDQDEDWVIV